MVTSEHSASRSSIRWLERTTAVPSAASRVRTRCTCVLAGRVQAVGRLVEHEQPRPGQQRGGQPEPLAHAEGEAADPVVGDVGEPDLLEHVVDARRAARHGRASAASAARFCRAVSDG